MTQHDTAPKTHYQRLSEQPVEGKPLGRHVNHDPRSLAYLVQSDGTIVSKRWDRKTPILDQGNLGSCTGNAAIGVLGTEPYYDTLPGSSLDEAAAITLYSVATKLDPYDGSFPPDDTGSDGLSVAKAAKAAGLISGYLHLTSVAACHTAIQSGPFIVGSDWYAGFDSPGPDFVVTITGTVRGGHEYECVGYDANVDLWEFVNSWGTSYGHQGRFFYSSMTFEKLLAANGDATSFVPITSPAPKPDPDAVLAQQAKIFTATHHVGGNERMSKALKAWMLVKGY